MTDTRFHPLPVLLASAQWFWRKRIATNRAEWSTRTIVRQASADGTADGALVHGLFVGLPDEKPLTVLTVTHSIDSPYPSTVQFNPYDLGYRDPQIPDSQPNWPATRLKMETLECVDHRELAVQVINVLELSQTVRAVHSVAMAAAFADADFAWIDDLDFLPFAGVVRE